MPCFKCFIDVKSRFLEKNTALATEKVPTLVIARNAYGRLRGEKLNYNSCTNLLLRKSQNLHFLAPEVQWALKVYHVCSIHVFFQCFEPRPYLVCHVTTIENVQKLGLRESFSKYNNTFCQHTALSTTCSIRLRKCTIFRKL